MPKGHCMFCDCVFDNEEAFRASAHPEEFEFPNVEQPKYEGPPLTPAAMAHGPVFVERGGQSSRKKRKPDYVVPEKKIPALKISWKSLVSIFVVIAVVIGVFCAVSIPLVKKRNAQQAEIAEQLIEYLPDDLEQDVLIQELNSTHAAVVLKQPVDRAKAIELFEAFCDIRADVLEIKDPTFANTRGNITFRVATPMGGYLIHQPANADALTEDSLKRLP